MASASRGTRAFSDGYARQGRLTRRDRQGFRRSAGRYVREAPAASTASSRRAQAGNTGLESRASFVDTKAKEGDASLKRALSLAVVLAVACAVAPRVVYAQGSRGGHVAGSSRSGTGFLPHKGAVTQTTSVFPQRVDPWKSWGTSHVRRHHHGGHDGPFIGTPGFIGTPSVVVSAPAVSEVLQGTTVIYAPGVPAPAAGLTIGGTPTPPMPTLVEHPSGWYQLRGDGVTTAYSWVWIPKPPVPLSPSIEPVPSARGPDAPDRSARARDDRGPAYHWTDGGVTTWTNRLERVPRRFRDQAAATAQPD